MITTTNKSTRIAYLLYCMRSANRNIGIVGNYWYGISCRGIVSRFDLRHGYQNDSQFPGIHNTQAIIPAKQMVDILASDFSAV